MPITNRTLEPGTILVATYKKVLHRCEVVASDAGPRYRLDGIDHKSPSTAASAVVGGNRNGWTFWSVEGSEVEAEVPVAIAPVTAATIRKTPNQKGVADGSTRWHCSTCKKSFVVPADETPVTCPEGHTRPETSHAGLRHRGPAALFGGCPRRR